MTIHQEIIYKTVETIPTRDGQVDIVGEVIKYNPFDGSENKLGQITFEHSLVAKHTITTDANGVATSIPDAALLDHAKLLKHDNIFLYIDDITSADGMLELTTSSTINGNTVGFITVPKTTVRHVFNVKTLHSATIQQAKDRLTYEVHRLNRFLTNGGCLFKHRLEAQLVAAGGQVQTSRTLSNSNEVLSEELARSLLDTAIHVFKLKMVNLHTRVYMPTYDNIIHPY